MSDALWLSAAALCSLSGMTWLALSIKFHWRQTFPASTAIAKVKRLRTFGFIFIALSLVCCGRADHPSMASLVWFLLQAFAAFAVAMSMSRFPEAFRFMAPSFFFRENA